MIYLFFIITAFVYLLNGILLWCMPLWASFVEGVVRYKFEGGGKRERDCNRVARSVHGAGRGGRDLFRRGAVTSFHRGPQTGIVCFWAKILAHKPEHPCMTPLTWHYFFMMLSHQGHCGKMSLLEAGLGAGTHESRGSPTPPPPKTGHPIL